MPPLRSTNGVSEKRGRTGKISDNTTYNAKAPGLEFVIQTGDRVQDPAVRQLIRRHAASTKGGKQRPLVVHIPLEIPDTFVQAASEGLSTHINAPVRTFNQPGMFQTSINQAQGLPCSLSLVEDDPHNLNAQVMDTSKILQDYPWNPTLTLVTREVSGMSSLGDSCPAWKPCWIASKKNRNGCNNCRTHCVKCDEKNPACNRCLRLNGTRDRYLPNLRASREDSSQLSQYRPSQAMPFKEHLESVYFQAFQEETALELAGVFHTSLWQYIILQACHHEEFVLHAVVALGALEKSSKANWMAEICSKSSVESWQTLAVSHRNFAFKAYGASLRKMKNISWADKTSPRRSLIACLLIFVFETFSGQLDMAFSQFTLGDRLACEFVKDTHFINPRQAGIASPASNIVEDDLLSGYVRVSVQMMMFNDRRHPNSHHNGKNACPETIASMPPLFCNLTEARLYSELLMRRCCHFSASAYAITQSKILQRNFMRSSPGRCVDITSGSSIYSSPYLVPEWLKTESASHASDIDRWSSAFGSLIGQAFLDPANNIGALLLRIHMITIKIVVQGTMFIEETSYDPLLAAFREIVALSRHVAVITLEQPTFHLDLGIVPPLFIVILRCRDEAVRREALDLLQSSRHQDGIWNRRMIAKAGRWIMEKEERLNLKPIPEQERLRFARAIISLEKRSMMLQCVRRTTTPHDVGSGEPQLLWEEVEIKDW